MERKAEASAPRYWQTPGLPPLVSTFGRWGRDRHRAPTTVRSTDLRRGPHRRE